MMQIKQELSGLKKIAEGGVKKHKKEKKEKKEKKDKRGRAEREEVGDPGMGHGHGHGHRERERRRSASRSRSPPRHRDSHRERRDPLSRGGREEEKGEVERHYQRNGEERGREREAARAHFDGASAQRHGGSYGLDAQHVPEDVRRARSSAGDATRKRLQVNSPHFPLRCYPLRQKQSQMCGGMPAVTHVRMLGNHHSLCAQEHTHTHTHVDMPSGYAKIHCNSRRNTCTYAFILSGMAELDA
jgi:hypothetical protein